MLTEERFSEILRLLQSRRAVTVGELSELLETSDSTIRRDLNALQEMGKLKKVHGGATALGQSYMSFEEDVATKLKRHMEEKDAVARYAASTILDDDFVFIDAGTTTERLVEHLGETKASFVTNGIAHAQKLLQKGLTTYVVGGQLKRATEAVVGAEAVRQIQKYNFTKSFLGANGITEDAGFTTPLPEEALVKEAVTEKSFVSYVLCDSSKFGLVSAVTFAELSKCCIITDRLPDPRLRDHTAIKEVLT